MAAVAAESFSGPIYNVIRAIFSGRETDGLDYLPKIDLARLLFVYFEKKPFTDRTLEDSYNEMDVDKSGKVSNIGNSYLIFQRIH